MLRHWWQVSGRQIGSQALVHDSSGCLERAPDWNCTNHVLTRDKSLAPNGKCEMFKGIIQYYRAVLSTLLDGISHTVVKLLYY